METTASSPSILVSVGLSFVTEYDEHVSSEKLSILERALTDFLENRKSFFETAQIYQTTIGTTKPIDRIATILQTPDLPIPNFSMFNQGGSSSRKKTRSWTEYEDQRLLAGIHRFGTDNWLIVANFVGNGRTRAQCSQRWIRGLDPRISKDKWSKEDEELLLRLVEQYGTKCWTRIAQEMGNRSDVQCRYHFKQMKNEEQGETQLPTKISASGSVPIYLNLNFNQRQQNSDTNNATNNTNIMNPQNLLRPAQKAKVALPSIADFLNSPQSDNSQQQLQQNQQQQIRSGIPPIPRMQMSSNTSLPILPSFQSILENSEK